MQKIATYLVIALSTFAVVACLEPFDFESGEFDKVLVIEGLLTNETKSHEVKLSYTYPLDSGSQASNLTGADVYVEDNNGSRIQFYDQSNGTYLTLSNVQGELGKSYRLVVTTPDQEVYESRLEPMTISPAIDSIYDKYVELPNEETNQTEAGIQFFLDTHDPTEQARFFRYEYDETYQISVPFPSFYEVVDTSVVLRTQPVGKCFEFDKSSSVLIGSSANTNDSRLAEYPIRFLFESSQYIRTRYSILVRQYAISESAYLYYRKLKENNESSGSLFDKQPGTVVGNISSVSDPNKPILGYFEVSGVSEKREFFSPSDFAEDFNIAKFKYQCFYNNAQILDIAATVEYINNSLGYEIYTVITAPSPDVSDSTMIFTKTCTSCNWYADTNVPSYWID